MSNLSFDLVIRPLLSARKHPTCLQLSSIAYKPLILKGCLQALLVDVDVMLFAGGRARSDSSWNPSASDSTQLQTAALHRRHTAVPSEAER